MTATWAPGWIPGQQSAALAGVAASRAVTSADRYLEVDATTQSIVLTLPTAVGVAGQTFTFIRTDSVTATNTVTVTTTAGQTISGLPSQLLVFQGQILTVLSDGQNWLVCYSNYNGKQLGYAETFNAFASTTTVLSDAALNAAKVPGLSITVIGAGRLVSVRFLAPGAYNSTTANTAVAATLMINSSQTNGAWAKVSSPETALFGAFRTLTFERSLLLTAGTSYTFEVGVSAESGTANLFASSVWFPTSLKVVGE